MCSSKLVYVVLVLLLLFHESEAKSGKSSKKGGPKCKCTTTTTSTPCPSTPPPPPPCPNDQFHVTCQKEGAMVCAHVCNDEQECDFNESMSTDACYLLGSHCGSHGFCGFLSGLNETCCVCVHLSSDGTPSTYFTFCSGQ